jgi:hypothetical protein
MGLFDNPEFFQPEKPLKSINDVVTNTSHIGIPMTQSNHLHSIESKKNVSENLPETGAPPQNMKLLIIKIILTLCFGCLINQLTVHLLVFTLINIYYGVEKSERKQSIQIVYCILGGLSSVYLTILLLFFWRTTKRWLRLIVLILLAQLVCVCAYPILIYEDFQVDTCKKSTECVKNFSAALFMVLTHLASIVLVIWEYLIMT